MKKLSIFLCFVLLIGFITALPTAAAKISFEQQKIDPSEKRYFYGENAAELLVNNSFEIAADGEVSEWRANSNEVVDGKGQSFYGSANINRTTDAHSGSYAIRFTNTQGGKSRVSQQVNVTGGVTYELSAWVKSLSASPCDIYIQGGFYGKAADGTALDASAYSYLNLYFQSSTGTALETGVWKNLANRFTAPEGATSVILYVYLAGNGDVIWDDIALMCPTESVAPLDVSEKKAPVLSADSNVLGPVYALNSDKTNFEGFAVGTMIGKSDKPGGHHIQVTDAQNHTQGGSKSLLMHKGINPDHASFGMANLYYNDVKLIAGATYQISCWIYAPEPGMSDDFSYWINMSLQDGTTDTKKKHWTIRHFPWWREIIFDFEVPTNIKSTSVQLCHQYGSSPFYVDDIQLYMIKAPDYATVEADELFYYTEWEKGICTAKINDAYGNVLAGGKAQFDFLSTDKETVIESDELLFENGIAQYEFDLSLMEEKGKEYFISVSILDGGGDVMQENLLSVYRFDRPTYLGADGIFRKNGKEYNLALGYSINSDRLEMGPQKGGCQIVSLVVDASDATIKRTTEEKIARAHELGLVCLISVQGSLYNPEALANTARNLKDLPGLFGYKLYDEPYQAGIPDEVMKNAYVALRNVDPDHPVYVDDSVDGGYAWLYRYSDIMDIDYYGGSSSDSGRIFTQKFEHAKEVSKGRKPYMLVQQVFTNGGYRPAIDELRNFAYQAFFAGISGFSWFSLATDSSGGDKDIFMTTSLWQQICDIWAPWEQGFLFDCFVNGKYELLSSYRDDNAMWRTYKDGNKIFLIVFNRQKNANTPVTVPLVDSEGKQLMHSFTATRRAGALGEAHPTVMGRDSLSLNLGGIMVGNVTGTESTLNGLAAEIWEITPCYTAEDFENVEDVGIYKTYYKREVEITEDPLDSTNHVLHAAPFPSAISLLPMVSGTGTVAPVSEYFAEGEIGKITYKLYVPSQDALAVGNEFSAGIRYTDASGNMVSSNVNFTAGDLNKWHDMEFYFNGFTALPLELCQNFSTLSLECYIDDLKVEKVKDKAFLSTMNASASAGRSKPGIWAFAATGTNKTSFEKTDTVRPVMGFVPENITDKAYASAALYKVKDGVLSLVDVKMATLGRTPLASLVNASAGASAIGITVDELAINLSDYNLEEGVYTVVYMMWNQNDLSPLIEKTVFSVG